MGLIETPKRRLFLDTNAVIAYLDGSLSEALYAEIKASERFGISIVTLYEFLSFGQLTDGARQGFARLLGRAFMVDIRSEDDELHETVIHIRQTYPSVKLPDAIIAASAKVYDATLVTNDGEILSNVVYGVQAASSVASWSSAILTPS